MITKNLTLGLSTLGLTLLLAGFAATSATAQMGDGHAHDAEAHDAPADDTNMPEGHPMMGQMHGNQEMHCQMHDCVADAEAAQAVLQAYSAAINAEDIDAMAAQVVADERFSVIEGAGTNSGWADYRDHHIGPEFASERIDFHVYGYDNIDVRVGHLFAYATFTYAFEATLDGEPYNKEGRGTAVLLRTPEGWRITHIQTS